VTEEKEIKSYGVPFVIDFGSDSCIPCKEMAPVLETLHEEFQGKAIVHFVDVWKN
jgi:thioredoxin 1